MKYSEQVKPISYLKSHTADVVRDLNEHQKPLIITQNGEAKIVVQDIQTYEQTQETLALLKILALGNSQIEQGRVGPATEAFKRVRGRKDSA
jgi:prevent-host-death family protein